MAKLSSVELSNRINDLEIPEDVKISLIEDVTDSVDSSSLLEERDKQIETLTTKYNDLEKKYKLRFLSSDDKKEETDSEGLEEKEVIDVKEI